ncbi:hypothetical protein BGZ93_000583 [Podila epicladia]|nr:hypothetical protein BGZ92_007536 [Podila epicladia]KAG0098275.1 hypothetical protein BGZ93_000583 [Podila epicladia]
MKVVLASAAVAALASTISAAPVAACAPTTLLIRVPQGAPNSTVHTSFEVEGRYQGTTVNSKWLWESQCSADGGYCFHAHYFKADDGGLRLSTKYAEGEWVYHKKQDKLSRVDLYDVYEYKGCV